MTTKRNYKLTPEERDWGIIWKVEVWNDFGMKRIVYEKTMDSASKVIMDWWERSKEEFDKIMSEAKITPAKVQKIQKDLVTTIDLLKKNFPMYKAAKEAGDEKKFDKHRKIALNLTKKKKDLEIQMDKALGGLYQDAELELKETKLNEAINMYDDVIALKRSFDIFKQQSPELYKQLDAKFKVKNIQKTLGDMQKFMDTPQAYR